jgi:hypothetical protein
MNILRSLLCVFVFLYGFTGFVFSDDGAGALLSTVRNVDISPSAVVEDMKGRFGLSDEQAEKVLPIIEAQTKGIQQIADDLVSGNVSNDSLSRMQAVRDNTDKDLAKILTAQQMELWHKFIAQGQERVRKMMQDSDIGKEN